MNPTIKIALADDELLIRQGIKNFLSEENNFEILFDVANGQELITTISQSIILPDIILMDINMPELNGIEATEIIVEKYPTIKIVALSSYNTNAFMRKMITIGAVCYIAKTCSPADLIFKLNKVDQDGFYYEAALVDFIRNNSVIQIEKEISDREKDVLQLICQQKSSTEIADILFISPRTVDNHRNSLLQKTNSKNIIGLVIYAIQNKLYLPHE